jgi:hypothetical protein
MANDQAELRQAAEDLDAIRAQLQAAGIVLAAVAYAMADACEAKGRRVKAERKAARQATQKAAQPG